MYAFRLPATAALLLLAVSLCGATSVHAQYGYSSRPFWHDAAWPPAVRDARVTSRKVIAAQRRPRAAVVAAIPLPTPRPPIPAAPQQAQVPASVPASAAAPPALASSPARVHLSPRVGSAEWQAEQAAMAHEDARIRQIINSICRGC